MKKTVKKVTFSREWTSDAGFTNYYFDIVFEDDTTGWFASNKMEQDKFVVGKEYDVETRKKNKKGEPKWDIIKEAYKGGGRGLSPEEKDRMFRGSAMKSTIEWLLKFDQTDINQDHISQIHDAFVKFLKDKEHTFSSTAALHDAIAMQGITSLRITTTKHVLKLAEDLYTLYVDNTPVSSYNVVEEAKQNDVPESKSNEETY